MAEQVKSVSQYSNAQSVQFGQPITPPAPEMPRGGTSQRGGVQSFDAQTGAVKQGSVTQTTTAPTSTDPLDHAFNRSGYRVARSAIQPDSIVKLRGIEGDVAGFEQLGLLRRDASGQYHVVAESEQPKPSQEQPKPQQETVPSAKLSQETEASISQTVQALGTQATYALLSQLTEGKDVKNLGELASRMGQEPAQFEATVQRVTSEMVAQSQRAVGMDSETWDRFVDFMWKTDPNASRAARDAAFDKGDLRGVKALAQRFQSEGASGYSDEEFLRAQCGEGLSVERDSNGRVLISIKGQRMLLRDAIRQGIVSVR